MPASRLKRKTIVMAARAMARIQRRLRRRLRLMFLKAMVESFILFLLIHPADSQ